MPEVKAYDRTQITISTEVIDHVLRKHPQMLSTAGLDGERLLSAIIHTLEKPNEAFADAQNTRYFLSRIDHLYLNVIVRGDSVKTAYLMGERSHRKMERTRWLRRLF